MKRVNGREESATGGLHVRGGLLSLCFGCKRARNTSGGWEVISSAVLRAFAQNVTHGVCPACYESQIGRHL